MLGSTCRTYHVRKWLAWEQAGRNNLRQQIDLQTLRGDGEDEPTGQHVQRREEDGEGERVHGHIRRPHLDSEHPDEKEGAPEGRIPGIRNLGVVLHQFRVDIVLLHTDALDAVDQTLSVVENGVGQECGGHCKSEEIHNRIWAWKIECAVSVVGIRIKHTRLRVKYRGDVVHLSKTIVRGQPAHGKISQEPGL